MAALGTESDPLRVAIIGAGPTGFFAAAQLLDSPALTVAVDLYDRLPTPFGLVRGGVAPDHFKIKGVAAVFARTAQHPRFRFFGHVRFGQDVGLDDLTQHYHQILFTTGAQTDRRMNVPGEDLAGSHAATEFVSWYNGHPDCADQTFDLSGRHAVVVGVGNVAIDVARILARDPEELAKTDISDAALTRLRGSAVRDVHVLARRGPVQAKCSAAELKEMAQLAGVDLVVDPAELELDEASAAELAGDREAQKNLEILRELAARGTTGAPRRIHLRFKVSPVEILGEDGRVAALRLERNRLVPGRWGVAAEGTGETETLPVGLVVRAVGYRSLPIPGVPFDERKAIVPNEKGRVLDPATGSAVAGLYVAGWVKRGPTGLIGSNKPDGAETAAAMLEDLPATAPAPEWMPEAVDAALAARGVRRVDFEAWRRLDRLEIERGRAQGRPRVKLGSVEEMLAALDAAPANA